MNKDNKNTEVNDTDKKLHISDVSDSLWDHGTCWVLSPVTNAKTTHISRRNKETKVVQFYVDDKTCDNGEGYWLDFNRGWWDNFIPNSDICSFNTKFNKMEEDKNLEQNLDGSNEKLHISDVSVLLLNKLLLEYHNYAQRLKNSSDISDEEYKIQAKGIWGCIQIAKMILSNEH